MILAILLAAAAATTPASKPAPKGEPGIHVAFVGQLLSIQEMNPCKPGTPLREGETVSEAVKAANAAVEPAEGAGATQQIEALQSMCMPFNQIFRVRYRLLETLAGTAPGPEVEFHVADHYGVPSFTQGPQALLVVTFLDGEAWLQKYQGLEVVSLRNGGWAMCGSLQDHPYLAAPASEPLEFTGPGSTFDVTGAVPAALDELRKDRDYDVTGTTATCRRGVRVAKALRFLQDGVLKARGVVLEPAQARP